MLDRCHGDESTQEEVFEGVKPMYVVKSLYRAGLTAVKLM